MLHKHATSGRNVQQVDSNKLLSTATSCMSGRGFIRKSNMGTSVNFYNVKIQAVKQVVLLLRLITEVCVSSNFESASVRAFSLKIHIRNSMLPRIRIPQSVRIHSIYGHVNRQFISALYTYQLLRTMCLNIAQRGRGRS